MPSIVCRVCEKRYQIPTMKWKLIIPDEPYVCSAKCVLEWITRMQKIDPHLVVPNGMIWNEPGYVFKSDYEFRFYDFLKLNKIKAYYEACTFPVGNSFYTPDFYVSKGSCFLETKGLWQIGQKKKFIRFRKQYLGITVLVIPWIIQSEF